MSPIERPVRCEATDFLASHVRGARPVECALCEQAQRARRTPLLDRITYEGMDLSAGRDETYTVDQVRCPSCDGLGYHVKGCEAAR